MIFVSKYKNYKLKVKNYGIIEFVGESYATEDEAEIKAIKETKVFGKDFYAVEEAEVKEAAKKSKK